MTQPCLTPSYPLWGSRAHEFMCTLVRTFITVQCPVLINRLSKVWNLALSVLSFFPQFVYPHYSPLTTRQTRRTRLHHTLDSCSVVLERTGARVYSVVLERVTDRVVEQDWEQGHENVSCMKKQSDGGDEAPLPPFLYLVTSPFPCLLTSLVLFSVLFRPAYCASLWLVIYWKRSKRYRVRNGFVLYKMCNQQLPSKRWCNNVMLAEHVNTPTQAQPSHQEYTLCLLYELAFEDSHSTASTSAIIVMRKIW